MGKRYNTRTRRRRMRRSRRRLRRRLRRSRRRRSYRVASLNVRDERGKLIRGEDKPTDVEDTFTSDGGIKTKIQNPFGGYFARRMRLLVYPFLNKIKLIS